MSAWCLLHVSSLQNEKKVVFSEAVSVNGASWMLVTRKLRRHVSSGALLRLGRSSKILYFPSLLS